MLILLPPSEGKTGPRRGRPLELAALSWPELADDRRRMVDALVSASSGPDALEILKVGESLAAEARANVGLWDAPAAPARDVYTGVLYDALDVASLSPTGRRRAQASVVIFSALFGALRLGDRVPAYRLSGDTALPGVGTPASYWRGRLDSVLEPENLVVDCRSGLYAGFWTPRRALPVRVFREVAGRRTVVSHQAKHARGLVARALCSAPRTPRTPAQAAAAASAWFAEHEVLTARGVRVRTRVELTGDSLDVITD